MLMGDDWTQAVPGGKHVGLQESSTRELVWAEEIATFFSQWATNPQVTNMPDVSESMSSLMSQDEHQHPPKNDANEAFFYWPTSTDMDAVKVEAVISTFFSNNGVDPIGIQKTG